MSCRSDRDVISAINWEPIKIINGREQRAGTEGSYKATSARAARDAAKATDRYLRARAPPHARGPKCIAPALPEVEPIATQGAEKFLLQAAPRPLPPPREWLEAATIPPRGGRSLYFRT